MVRIGLANPKTIRAADLRPRPGSSVLPALDYGLLPTISCWMFADLIAVAGNPLENIDALRDVRFVMKNGKVFKRDGVMTPSAFFNGGPVNGWNAR